MLHDGSSMLKLWILGAEEDEDFLKTLITKLGEFKKLKDQPHKSFTYGEFQECEVTKDELTILDSYWGRFMWGGSPSNMEHYREPRNEPKGE